MILEFLHKHRKIGDKLVNKYVDLFEGDGEKTSRTLRKYCKLRKVDIGLYTYGSCFNSEFNTGGAVTIGRYCSIAGNVRYFGANHPIQNISTSAYWYNKSFGQNVEDVERNHLYVGNDVWIGYGVIITAGCHSIGNGAVIGAGSVVTKDVAPYTIVAGNPAKMIRRRFSDDTIQKIEASEWWMSSPDNLYLFYKYMNEPERFLKHYKID